MPQRWDMGWFSSFEFTSTTDTEFPPGSLGCLKNGDIGSTCHRGTQNLGMQLANDADLDARADDMRLHPGKEGLGCHGRLPWGGTSAAVFVPRKKNQEVKGDFAFKSIQIILSPRQVAGSLLASSLKVLRLEPSFCSCSGSPQCSIHGIHASHHGMDAQQLKKGLCCGN